MNNKRFFYLLLPFVLLLSCVNDSLEYEEFSYYPEDYKALTQSLDLPKDPFNYFLNPPAHVASRPLSGSDNQATLGRVLFYDKALSKNGTVSCASCHKQEIAFSDNRSFSEGFDGAETARNSIALGSVVGFATVYGSATRSGAAFFWDERAESAAQQSIMSITDAIEMGMTRDELVNVVRSKDYYPILFKYAFGQPEITEDKILIALESFVDGIGSFDSKLDQAISFSGNTRSIEQELFILSDEENRGRALFVENCISCHGNQFAGPPVTRANNGLDRIYADKGIGGIIHEEGLLGVFKVPSLRNITLTAPYMHDGRFASLEEVLDFYSSNIKAHKNLDFRLKTFNSLPKRFNFSETEKEDLISFLGTLTDETFLQAEKYSDPFK